MRKTLASLEIAFSVFLFWTILLPFENYEQLIRLTLGAALLWLILFLFTRSRILLSSSVLFHFSLLISFYMKLSMAHGWLSDWFLWIMLAQWGATLLFFLMRPEDQSAPTLFLIACLISPLAAHILNAYDSSFAGFWLWSLLVLRLYFLNVTKSSENVSFPWYILVLLVISWCAIPFSLYQWRSIQFFLITAVCFVAYASLSNKKDLTPLLFGYLASALTLIAFAYSREIAVLQEIGPAVFQIRLSIVQFHNDLVPTFIIVSAILLHFHGNIRNRFFRRGILFCIVLLALLLFLTYSRNGWIAYALFVGCYSLLRKRIKLLFAIAGTTICFLLFFTAIRSAASYRFVDRTSINYRIFNFKTGLRSIAEHPVLGAGWLNLYSHTKQSSGISTFERLYENQLLKLELNHSMILDLAETAGIPFALFFLFILFRHLIPNGSAALTAGLAGITLSSAADSASFWLPVYPHIWILLGLIASTRAKPEVAKRNPLQILLIGLLAMIALALVEERSLELASFFRRTNHDDLALGQIRFSRIVAPLDVRPMEQLKDLLLAREDLINAEAITSKLISVKKEYPPFYAERGRIEILRGNVTGSLQDLQKAIELDPYGALETNAYVYMLSPEFGHAADRETLLRNILILRSSPHLPLSARKLWNHQNLIAAISYVDKNMHSQDDWIAAYWNMYYNCVDVGKPDLAQFVLEEALHNKKPLDDWDITDLALRLIPYYTQDKDLSKLAGFVPVASRLVMPALLARIQIMQGDLAQGYENLQASLKFYNPRQLQDLYIAYYSKQKKPEAFRKFLSTLEKFPSTEFQPAWRESIANSYYQKRDYEKAAQEFHRLASYNYPEPVPHWRETRSWWLARKSEKAKQANDRLQALISPNWFTRNLYASTIDSLWAGTWITNVSLPNSAGGSNWRTAIFAHPQFTATFPDHPPTSSIHSEVALMAEIWDEQTDGVRFKISDENRNILNSVLIDPQNNPDQRRWNPLDTQLPSTLKRITLSTEPNSHSNYDWAIWTFE